MYRYKYQLYIYNDDSILFMKIPIRQIKESDTTDTFLIRNIESLVGENDMIQELHRHDFFFVLAIEKGAGEHIIDFISYPIQDNSIFIMRPGQVHQLTLKKGSKGYLMEFNANFHSPHLKTDSNIFRRVSNKNYCPLHAESMRRLLNSLERILYEYDEKRELFRDMIKAEMAVFFIELFRQSQNSDKALKHVNSYSQGKLEDFLELLGAKIGTLKQVTHYADMLNLTPFQLNAITKETLGKTCSQIINEQILLEAKRQLLATTNQVNQIAFELGYEDVSYFIRFFKKHTKYSPDSYRKNFK